MSLNLFNLFILISSLFISCLSTKQIMSLEGEELDLQIKSSMQSNFKLFLIFYVNNCQYCNMAIKILKNQIIKNYEDEDEINFGTINLDNQKNAWLGLRFNVTRIPYIILIERNKMYLFQKNFEEKGVINFINEEKNIEDAFDIPEEITFFSKFKAAMNELSSKIEKVLEMYGINKKWGIKLSYFVIIVGVISFIYLENKLIDYCKNSYKKKDNNDENNNNIKENVNKNTQDKAKKE